MSAYPFTLTFTKVFQRGVLAGKMYHDSLPVVSAKSARDWLAGVDANCQDYKVIEAAVTDAETMRTVILRKEG